MRILVTLGLLLMAVAGTQPAAAQMADPRVTQLEEQVRSLNGRLEDMAFQLLQMQDQVRRMQEDFEFRFQELEKGSGGSGTTPAATGDRTSVEPPAGTATTETATAAEPATTGKEQSADRPVRVVTTERPASGDAAPAADVPAAVSPDTAAAPAGPDATETTAAISEPAVTSGEARDLGSLRFDELGRIVGAEQSADDNVAPGTEVASLPAGTDAEQLYNTGYERVLSGDYAGAEGIFRQQIAAFPDDPLAADARYWLGETLLAQKRYDEAADAFIEAHNVDPNARKAPETLMKLGVSMAALGNRDIACATFAEAASRYPNASPNVVQRLEAERVAAGC